jgi:Tfp pilus assembly protein FimT
MLQRARSEAAKQNSPAGVNLSGSQFWIDTNANSSIDTNENARLLLPGGITVENSGMPADLDAATLGNASGATITVAGSTSAVYFNARGLPCPYDSSTKTCNAAISGSAYVYYFQDTRFLGSSGWAAVSVSPAGRVKVWKWNGAEWK